MPVTLVIDNSVISIPFIYWRPSVLSYTLSYGGIHKCIFFYCSVSIDFESFLHSTINNTHIYSTEHLCTVVDTPAVGPSGYQQY